MKYFKEGDILLSDFDGVFLNSQVIYNEAMKGKTSLVAWTRYLNSIDWYTFLHECDEIPEARETFIELQKLKILRGFITRIHSFYEGMEKARILREVGIEVPLYYVLPGQPKSEVYIPNSHTIILEDDVRNTSDWVKHGGKAILYNPEIKRSNDKEIKKISYLLKK